MSGKRPFLVRLLRAPVRLATDREYRNAMWLRVTRPKNLFQPSNRTAVDRYPRTFRFVQSALGADNAVKILSVGCSTGEEVFSLRGYFPRATIKGIDINARNIAACRKSLRRVGDAGISFETAGSTAGEPAGTYDAIFCMAMLRHGALARPGVTRCDHLIKFEDFAAAIRDFSRCLKPGGLLAIRASNFRLADAPAAADFESVLRSEVKHPERVPIFGTDNRLLSGVTYPDTVFRKKPA